MPDTSKVEGTVMRFFLIFFSFFYYVSVYAVDLLSTESFLAKGDVVGAFFTHVDSYSDQELASGFKKQDMRYHLNRIDQFFDKYQQNIENSGISKEELLTIYMQNVYRTSEMSSHGFEGEVLSSEERYGDFNSVIEYYQEKYPQVQNEVDKIKDLKAKFEENRDNPDALVDYYLNNGDQRSSELALQILKGKSEWNAPSSDAIELSNESKLKILEKLNEGLPPEYANQNYLASLMSNIPNEWNQKLLTQDHIDYVKTILEKVGKDTQYDMYGGDGTHKESLACFDLYNRKGWINQNIESIKQNGQNLDGVNNYNLLAMIDSYRYFKAIGVDTKSACSDGVPYEERLKQFLQEDLEINDQNYCSLMMDNEEQNQFQMPKEKQKTYSDVEMLEHMTNSMEGLISFIEVMEVDKGVNCPNGKTLDELIHDKVNELIEFEKEVTGKMVNHNNLRKNDQIGYINLDSLPTCETTLEGILESDLPCDVSHVIDQLADSIKKVENGLKEKNFTDEYNEINGHKFWGAYPHTTNECYFNMVANYKANQVRYDVTLTMKGINYHFKVDWQQRDRFKNYLYEIKKILNSK